MLRWTPYQMNWLTHELSSCIVNPLRYITITIQSYISIMCVYVFTCMYFIKSNRRNGTKGIWKMCTKKVFLALTCTRTNQRLSELSSEIQKLSKFHFSFNFSLFQPFQFGPIYYPATMKQYSKKKKRSLVS